MMKEGKICMSVKEVQHMMTEQISDVSKLLSCEAKKIHEDSFITEDRIVKHGTSVCSSSLFFLYLKEEVDRLSFCSVEIAVSLFFDNDSQNTPKYSGLFC